jgi:hypothetical protein
MRDYFAALALRTLRPEIGVQPRRRSPFEDGVPRGSDEAFAANDEAIAYAARPNDVNEGNERASRSRRRITAEVDTSVDEPVVQPPVTLKKTRSRAVDRGDEVIAVPAAQSAGRVAEPTTIVRTEHIERDSHPLIRRAETRSDARRAPESLISHANERSAETSPESATRIKEAQPSEPTVRIHIGRVDVRAVTSTALSQPPRREGKATGLMTLDEYVKQRDGGRS